jgi:hypothetical protein
MDDCMAWSQLSSVLGVRREDGAAGGATMFDDTAGGRGAETGDRDTNAVVRVSIREREMTVEAIGSTGFVQRYNKRPT